MICHFKTISWVKLHNLTSFVSQEDLNNDHRKSPHGLPFQDHHLSITLLTWKSIVRFQQLLWRVSTLSTLPFQDHLPGVTLLLKDLCISWDLNNYPTVSSLVAWPSNLPFAGPSPEYNSTNMKSSVSQETWKLPCRVFPPSTNTFGLPFQDCPPTWTLCLGSPEEYLSRVYFISVTDQLPSILTDLKSSLLEVHWVFCHFRTISQVYLY